MLYLLIWIFCPIICPLIAIGKGRSVVGWFFLGLFLGPLALLVCVVSSNRTLERNALAEQRARAWDLRQARHCPFCAELIRPDAVLCRFCGKDVQPVATVVPPRPLGFWAGQGTKLIACAAVLSVGVWLWFHFDLASLLQHNDHQSTATSMPDARQRRSHPVGGKHSVLETAEAAIQAGNPSRAIKLLEPYEAAGDSEVNRVLAEARAAKIAKARPESHM
jgi:hypothetical protein